MSADDELIPLSALQHFVFCRRQCALIHLDGVWTENRLTAEGRAMHDRVDSRVHESRRDTCVAATLRLVSHKLGVAGVADMVEFHRVRDDDSNGAKLTGKSGRWIPFPVEYKHGKPNVRQADEVQLCAQAMCLEEMLNVAVPCGALFYGKTRHRLDVNFDAALRTLTEETARGVHALFAAGDVPPAEYGPDSRLPRQEPPEGETPWESMPHAVRRDGFSVRRDGSPAETGRRRQSVYREVYRATLCEWTSA